MAARKIEIDVRKATADPGGSGRVRWHLPPPAPSTTELLGEGPSAAPAVVEVFHRLGVLP
jgi:electron transfer flavoprotein beta subunit